MSMRRVDSPESKSSMEYQDDKETKETKEAKTQSQLMLAILEGNLIAAEKQIQEDKTALLVKSSVRHYSQRDIEATPLQLALAMQDVDLAIIIIKYLYEIDPQQIIQQITEQFPHGWQFDEEKQLQEDMLALRRAVQGIERDGHEMAAIAQFKQYIDDKAKNPLKSGKFFDFRALLYAFKLRNEYFDRFGGKDSYKNILYWTQVVGYLERLLPPFYAFALCDRIDLLVLNKLEVHRDASLRYSPETSFFPAKVSVSRSGLGYDYAIEGGRISRSHRFDVEKFEKLINYFRQFNESNEKQFLELIHDHGKHWLSQCNIL